MKYLIVIVLLSVLGCAPLPIEQSPWSPEPSIVVNENDWSYWSPTFKVAPKYPRSAQVRGDTGCTNISYVVNADGSVSNPVLVKSAGKNLFERASIEAALKFKYSPTELNESLEPVRTSNVFIFYVEQTSNPRVGQIMADMRVLCEVDLRTLPPERFSPPTE